MDQYEKDDLVMVEHSKTILEFMKWKLNFDEYNDDCTFTMDLGLERMFHYKNGWLFGHSLLRQDDEGNLEAIFFDYSPTTEE